MHAKGKSGSLWIIATACGCLAGVLTLQVEWLSDPGSNAIIGAAEKTVIVLIMPGMIGSMAFGGNVHAFSLWTAAAINTFIYSGLDEGSWTTSPNSVTKPEPACLYLHPPHPLE